MIGNDDLPFDTDERIIPPSYLSEDPDEDDDDDDDDDDIDPEDDFEIYKEAETEKILEEKENVMTQGQQSPFTSSPFNQPQQQTAWTPPTTTWQKPGWGNQQQTPFQSPFAQPQQQTTWNSGVTANQRKELPRAKKVVICDVLDGLMESIQSGGRPGLIPRGIYDSRIKFEVWDKLGCLGVEFVYGYSDVQTYSDDWSALCNYILRGLAQYLRLPAENCRSVVQMSYHQSKLKVIESVLMTLKQTTGYQKEDILMVGIGSGFANQNNRDLKIADELGIDYIDLGQFLSLYF